MRQIIVTLYKFPELPSEDAKEKARDYGRRILSEEPAWLAESRDSVQKFCEHFGVKLGRWQVSAGSHDFEVFPKNENFRGLKLRDFPRDNMPTGYWLDCPMWEAMHDEFKRTGDAKYAFEQAIHAGFKAWAGDLESQLSAEYVDDFLTANEYEFTEEGDRA